MQRYMKFDDVLDALNEIRCSDCTNDSPLDCPLCQMGVIHRQILTKPIVADMVAVVRCKDCRYCREEILYGKKTGDFICSHENWQDAEGWTRYVEPEDYCSHGERKDQNG